MNAHASRCPHCGGTSYNAAHSACTPRTWSCPACGDHGPDCAGCPLSSCRAGATRNAPHTLEMSAPRPGVPLYRELVTFGGRVVDVVLDGTRVFLLTGGRPGRDITAQLDRADVVRLCNAHDTLTRLDAHPFEPTPTADQRRPRGRRAA